MKPLLGATYRVQLRRELDFSAVARRLDYLVSIGIETLYCSPVLEAVPHSTHGYDGTDPTTLRAELGGADGFFALASSCEEHGLGICLDIVPNHLATWTKGPWWRQLLAEGPDGTYGDVFDIDWARNGNGERKVALPVLDRPLEDALDAGLVRLTSERGEIVLMACGVNLPIGGSGAGLDDDPWEVLAAQHYRLVDWHDKADRNYRRFFDIDGLVGVRVEDEGVFTRTHALVIELARQSVLCGLRVDHVDGLREPDVYLQRLKHATDLPIVVEKILTGDEQLRSTWPVAGTTGYEVLDDIGGALVSPSGFAALRRAGRRDGDGEVTRVTRATRALVATQSFPGEVAAIASTLETSPVAIRDTLVRLPVYRTYASGAAATRLSKEDQSTLLSAGGSRARDAVVAALFEPAHDATLLDVQQLSGALMAKGVEDTAWFRLSGPLAFLEVGGDPVRDRRGGVDRLHQRAGTRVRDGRGGLIASSTHDTKHSGDVRARLYALCECHREFEEGLARLRQELGKVTDRIVDAPRQTRLLGALGLAILPPLAEPGLFGELAQRVGDTLVKGAREAKEHTTWDEPDRCYEAALRESAEAAFENGATLLARAFGQLVDDCARYGAVLSLSSVLLRSCLPGTPDCYQGDEAWNLTLVDPDNRRLVDFDALRQLRSAITEIGEPRPGGVAALRRSWRTGAVKLLVTARCLAARRAVPDAFACDAPYEKLTATGDQSESVVSCLRRGSEGSFMLALATRLPSDLPAEGDDLPSGASFHDTVIELPSDAPHRWRDAIGDRHIEATSKRLAVSHLLGELPVALLIACSPAATNQKHTR